MLRQALERMPGNVDAMVGLAGMHLQSGALDEAADWCARALVLKPGHAATHSVRRAVGDALLKRGIQSVIDGQADAAIDTMARAVFLTESQDAQFYRDLLVLAAAWSRDAAELAAETDTIRLSLPVWGADYVAATTSGLLRTLLAPGNLPALAQGRAVRLEITTSARDRAALERAPVVAALRQHAAIDFFIVPDHLVGRPAPQDFSYWLMSAAHMATAERARRSGTGASFLTADMMLSDGSLAAARRMVDGGAQAVLTSALEVEPGSMSDGGGDDSGRPLSLNAGAMVRHALAHLRVGLPQDERPGPLLISGLASFVVDGGLAFRGFHFLPLMVSPALLARDFAFDYLTVDTRFIRLALGDLPPEGRVAVVTDTREIAVVSTLRSSRAVPRPSSLDGEQLGRWAANWCFTAADIAYFEWCFGHRVVYRDDPSRAASGVGDGERETVSAILRAYRRHACERVGNQPAAAIFRAGPGSTLS